MRIVHVLDSFFPDSLGGTENYVYFISQAMLQFGHEVYVVSSKKGVSCEYDYEGIKVYRFMVSVSASKKELIQLVAPEGLDSFTKIIKRISPNVVHFHTFNRAINAYHLRAVKALGIKTVFTAHQSGIFCLKGTMLDEKGIPCNGDAFNNPCLRCYLTQTKSKNVAYIVSIAVGLLEKLGLLHIFPCPGFAYLHYNRKRELRDITKYSDCNIAISMWVYNTFKINRVNNICLIPQGINPMFCISEEKCFKRADANRLKLLFVGRIYPIKGLDIFCKALELIDSKKVEVTFACVCGDDNYAEKIKSTIKSLPYFNWYENASSDKVKHLMQENDLLILPSQSEMSPLVVLEALACSLPVLGSNIAPITDSITDNVNGLIFEVNNPVSMAEQLNKVIETPSIINKLRKNIDAVRTLNNVADDLIQLYLKLQ